MANPEPNIDQHSPSPYLSTPEPNHPPTATETPEQQIETIVSKAIHHSPEHHSKPVMQEHHQIDPSLDTIMEDVPTPHPTSTQSQGETPRSTTDHRIPDRQAEESFVERRDESESEAQSSPGQGFGYDEPQNLEQLASAAHESALASGSVPQSKGQVCSNCKTTRTPLWRRAPNGLTICNACGLYLKARNAARPSTLKRPPNSVSIGGEGPIPIPAGQAQANTHAGAHYVADSHLAPGTCPGGGKCNGTGGQDGCDGCPAYNNRVSKAAKFVVGNNGTNAFAVDGPQGQHSNGSFSANNNSNQNGDLPQGLPGPLNGAQTSDPRVEVQLINYNVGLYHKLHGFHRPETMKKSVIKRRKRVVPPNHFPPAPIPRHPLSRPEYPPQQRQILPNEYQNSPHASPQPPTYISHRDEDTRMSDTEDPARPNYRAAMMGPDHSLANSGRYAPQDFTDYRTMSTTLAPMTNSQPQDDLRLSPMQPPTSPNGRKRSLSNGSRASVEPSEVSGPRLQSINSILNQPAAPIEPQVLQMSTDPSVKRQQLLTRKRLAESEMERINSERERIEKERDEIETLLKHCTDELYNDQSPAPRHVSTLTPPATRNNKRRKLGDEGLSFESISSEQCDESTPPLRHKLSTAARFNHLGRLNTKTILTPPNTIPRVGSEPLPSEVQVDSPADKYSPTRASHRDGTCSSPLTSSYEGDNLSDISYDLGSLKASDGIVVGDFEQVVPTSPTSSNGYNRLLDAISQPRYTPLSLNVPPGLVGSSNLQDHSDETDNSSDSSSCFNCEDPNDASEYKPWSECSSVIGDHEEVSEFQQSHTPIDVDVSDYSEQDDFTDTGSDYSEEIEEDSMLANSEETPPNYGGATFVSNSLENSFSAQSPFFIIPITSTEILHRPDSPLSVGSTISDRSSLFDRNYDREVSPATVCSGWAPPVYPNFAPINLDAIPLLNFSSSVFCRELGRTIR
ncbi:hypothetical protein ABW20_dc0101825 [Dactylellina cionopaga]|nr:hypothetical protein ABW20_dc0101825 [Dactylellina cionopaga]